MNFVKVSSSGQITLPKAFRKKYPVRIYAYSMTGDKFIIAPKPTFKEESIVDPFKKNIL